MTIRSQAGFSLIQVMVSTGLVGLLAMVGAQTMNSLAKNVRSIDSKNLTNSANQSIQVYLANENICTQSILPVSVKSLSQTELGFSVPGLGRFVKGEHNKEMDLETTGLSINNLVVSDTNPLGMKIYVGAVKMSFNRKSGQAAQSFRAIHVGAMSLMTDSSGKVLKCVLGKLSFTPVEQNDPATPTVPVVTVPDNGGNVPIAEYPPKNPGVPGGGAGGGGSGSGGGYAEKKTCSSIEQCAVYDYYLRNGFPNALAEADQWMASHSAWESIAKSYVDSMSGLGKLNFLASANQAGLIQTGRQGLSGNVSRPDTLDQWVAEAVANDPSGRSMLTTSEGIKTLGKLFDSSGTSQNTQQILRSALTKSADLTLNSSLGIGTWVEALGYTNVQEMAKDLPGATINAALSPGAGRDPQGLKSVIDYMQQNPSKAIEVANGTGLWAKNVDGGVKSVVDYISSNLAASGNNELAISVAAATNQWANAIGGSNVAAAISSNSSNALAVATGTAVWNNVVGSSAVNTAITSNAAQAESVARGTAAAVQIFGASATQSYISADTAKGAQGAAAIDSAKAAGYSDAEIKAYIEANPTTWQNWSK